MASAVKRTIQREKILQGLEKTCDNLAACQPGNIKSSASRYLKFWLATVSRVNT